MIIKDTCTQNNSLPIENSRVETDLPFTSPIQLQINLLIKATSSTFFYINYITSTKYGICNDCIMTCQRQKIQAANDEYNRESFLFLYELYWLIDNNK